jgi:pyruvate/2-oxoglutarate dehydrogenase complex dihydrolipoamide dehydrogenase (E3) component
LPAQPGEIRSPFETLMSESHTQSRVLPDDEHNRTLVANAHPADWVNPVPGGRYNLVVIGAGSAGLVSAIGAAWLGARVAIVERHLTGGDCLNFGCVPSKALISSARTATRAHRAEEIGLRLAPDGQVDFAAVMKRMRRLRAELAVNDSVDRLAAAGVDVYLGDGRFMRADAIEVADRRLTFSRAVIATGARAAVPDTPGLADAGYLTNETIFSLTARPRHLIVIGSGPVGCELAQTFRRFGSEVTIIARRNALLPREDPDASAVVARTFEREGVKLLTNACVLRVERRAGPLPHVVVYEADGRHGETAADALLIAIGRTPNVEGLNLAVAGIASNANGVIVNDALRTTNRRVYAAGDVCSRYKFTHAADAMARAVLHNALFFGRRRASALVIPWTTYTDPEVAHVGLSAEDAAQQGDRVRTLTVPLSQVDRAVLESEAEGFARVHVARGTGRILGATLVASHAGELIGEIAVAMKAGLSMSALGVVVHPYPTQSEAWKRLGDEWNRTRLTPGMRRLLHTLLRWRR